VFRAKSIQKRVRKQPFVPFRITTSSGEVFDVYHPEMIFVGRREIEIGTPTRDDPTIFEDVTNVAIMHITSIRNLPSRKRRDGNGEN
jgi:hypothetical protein